jgi:hypothetical protein
MGFDAPFAKGNATRADGLGGNVIFPQDQVPTGWLVRFHRMGILPSASPVCLQRRAYQRAFEALLAGSGEKPAGRMQIPAIAAGHSVLMSATCSD